ncbi:MAG: four helix bundle protein [Bacteroidetes bacterium]|nr:four helix bundle protein [Bacteroidota bacterium]MBU2508661.1 four helix bundle protein [Bacteroidota bacterium]
MSDFRDLLVYKKAFTLAMRIFEITKSFPKEEKYFYPVKFEINFLIKIRLIKYILV